MRGLLSILLLSIFLLGCANPEHKPVKPAVALPESTRFVSAQGNAHLRGLVKWAKNVQRPQSKSIEHVDLPDGTISDPSIKIGEAGGVQNALIYITNVSSDSVAPYESVTLRHQHCVFSPRTIGVRKGQKLIIENGDDIVHTNHVLSSQLKSPDYNAPIKSTETLLFEEEEICVKIVCDIHNWETANVGVFSHPYFTVSDAEGSFEFPVPVPAGRQKLMVWHERLGTLEREVELKPEIINFMEFEFSESPK